MKNECENEKFKNSNLVSLCDNIVAMLEPNKKTYGKCSKISFLLKDNFSATRRLYAKSIEFEQQNSELSDALSWLCDNYTMIEDEFSSCARFVKHEKAIIGKGAIPLLFSSFSKLLEFCDGKIENSHIVAIITACDRYCTSGLGVCDFSSAPTLTKSAVLCHIGKCCELIMKNSGFTDNDDIAIQLIHSIKSLRFLAVCDFNEAFSKCRLEVLLSKDPAGAYPRMTAASKNDLLHKISLCAKRKRICDSELVTKLLETADNAQTENEKYIGYSIENNKLFSMLYFPILYGVSLLFTIIFCIATNFWIFPILYFPVFESVKIIVDTVFSRLCKDA